jgi:Fe-S-cluster containining protein
VLDDESQFLKRTVFSQPSEDPSLMQSHNAEFRYPRNVRFKCSRCAQCCGDTKARIRHVLLLEKEAERISKFSNKPVEAFACRIVGHEPYLYEMKKGKGGKCVFLERKDCTIYASRPLICRYYPFELKTEGNEVFLFSPTDECSSIGVGDVLEESYFSNLFRLARRSFS